MTLLALMDGCSLDPSPGETGTAAENAAGKIELDLDALDSRGLQGPPDGLRSMAYEFCIPAVEAQVHEVTQIDPTVKVYRQSPGRIQCRTDQYLCIGETHQSRHRAVLHELAALPYVERIVPAYFE